MKSMENLMVVPENAGGIIGKFFYYSLANILIPKEQFIRVGMDFGLPKFKPAKESKAGAYRNATTALKERIEVKDSAGTRIYRIYCRDNKKEDAAHIYRELVKETLNVRTNEYKKLANIVFDKKTETMFSEDESYDPDVDVAVYSQQALTLYKRYCTCYTLDHVDSVIQDQLDRMQANKISIKGNLYFIPTPYLPKLNLLEDYIAAIGQYNLGGGLVMSNSMFVVDDGRQRQKMTEEFYVNYKRDMEQYQERIQHFIDTGCTSQAVISRWLLKIEALQEKKKTYEEVLKQKLNALNSDYAMLQMQSEELRVRSLQGQMKLAA